MPPPDPLETLYQDHAPALFRFLIRLTGNEAEVKDILQEIFIRLAKSPGILDNIDSPRAYLFRMAHRHAIDRMRREQTRQHYDLQARQEGESHFSPQASSQDDAWRRKLLGDSLSALPHEQKAVVLLKIWEGLTFAKIAEVLDIPADTAASRYRYALDKLRDALRPLHRDLP
jgi:RNA polymerase sigma-70 factor (ECF subfamily)